MADPDIPIAFGTVIPPYVIPVVATQTTPSGSNNNNSRSTLLHSTGRSSQILLPLQDSEPLRLSAIKILQEQGYTQGLADALNQNKRAFPLSIWVVDNSGSMTTNDGHRIVEQSINNNNGILKFVTCSRWREMQQTVDYHVQMAALLGAPTTFRMLNDPGRLAGPQQFSILTSNYTQCQEQQQKQTQIPEYSNNLDHELAVAQQVMLNAQPGGVTPLVEHIHEIRNNVVAMEEQLRSSGTKVVIVLATDGLPTDPVGYSNSTVQEQFVNAMRSLEGLPVWIVVRLCTDEEAVVDFWNNLDNQLELNLEVLDDFVAEAEEVYQHNKWLTYGLPLHRMREMGFHHRIFDLLDERKLSKDELREFCVILFGGTFLDVAPDPESDWKGFCNALSRALTQERKQYNSIHKKMEPWIDVKKLHREYGHSGLFHLF